MFSKELKNSLKFKFDLISEYYRGQESSMDIKSKKTLKTCLKTSLTDHLAFSFFNIDDFICSGLVL